MMSKIHLNLFSVLLYVGLRQILYCGVSVTNLIYYFCSSQDAKTNHYLSAMLNVSLAYVVA